MLVPRQDPKAKVTAVAFGIAVFDADRAEMLGKQHGST